MGFFRNLVNPEHGMVQANLRAYFASRVSGLGHADALANMVRTRYRFGGEKLGKMSHKLDEVLGQIDASPEYQLRHLTVEMYDTEVPERHVDFGRLGEALDEGIDEWRARYPQLSLSEE